MPLFAALQTACKGIASRVQRAAIVGATGLAEGGGENAGGEQQKKLDVVSNELLCGFLARSGVVRVLASEEVRQFHCLAIVGSVHFQTPLLPLRCSRGKWCRALLERSCRELWKAALILLWWWC